MKAFPKLITIVLIASTSFSAWSKPNIDAGLYSKSKRAVDDGIHYLRSSQKEDGSWSGSVGITAIALRGILESRRNYNEGDGPWITKPVQYLLDHVNEDGSISETNQNRNYNTAVAIAALQATGNDKYKPVISNAQKFITGLQLDGDKEYSKDHKYYGGIGYGGDERPDLSNQYIALEGLKATSLDKADPVWEKALVFISRAQNNSESNDQAWAADDGGFTYMPGFSPHGGTASYGSMTHAGLLSLLFAGADKSDPRVQAAHKWIQANYTLDTNPGAKNNQGIYYYYNSFAKSMYAWHEDILLDDKGGKHNWRNDFSQKMLELQSPDGSWVNSESPRWWEGNKDLVTAYIVVAMNYLLRD